MPTNRFHSFSFCSSALRFSFFHSFRVNYYIYPPLNISVHRNYNWGRSGCYVNWITNAKIRYQTRSAERLLEVEVCHLLPSNYSQRGLGMPSNSHFHIVSVTGWRFCWEGTIIIQRRRTRGTRRRLRDHLDCESNLLTSLFSSFSPLPLLILQKTNLSLLLFLFHFSISFLQTLPQ